MDILFKIKVLSEVKADDKVLIVGLPGMGGVAYTTANHIVNSMGGRLVAEFYTYSYPPQINISDGRANLFKAYLYETKPALVLTANAQPATPEAQNEFCDNVIGFLNRKGLRKIIATAAYVTSHVGPLRNVYVAGNDDSLINEFVKLNAQVLKGGVVSGINGAIVGWASYYDIPAVVLLAETWEAIVQVDEFDYRASKHLLDIVSKYLKSEVDTSVLDTLAEQVESKVMELITRSLKQFEVKKPSKDVM